MENILKRVPKMERNFKVEPTEEQKQAFSVIYDHTITVLTGVAGTSKSFTAVMYALKHFYKRKFNRITIMRPTVSTEDIGSLPGTIEDKFSAWCIPLIENMHIMEHKDTIDRMLKEGAIRMLPLQFTQGVTFSDEIVIIDEAQNATAKQFEMILTRIGKGSQMIFTGDPNQIQLKATSHSGFQRLIDIVPEIEQLGLVELHENYRDPIVREIIAKYNKG